MNIQALLLQLFGQTYLKGDFLNEGLNKGGDWGPNYCFLSDGSC